MKDQAFRTKGWSCTWVWCLPFLLLWYLGSLESDIHNRDIGIINDIVKGEDGFDIRTNRGNYLVVEPQDLSVGKDAAIYVDKIGFHWIKDQSGGKGRLYGVFQ